VDGPGSRIRFSLVTRPGWGALLFEGAFDLFAGVFEVAFGLIGLAFGFEGLVIGRFAEAFLDLAGGLLAGVLGLILCTDAAVSFYW
jgi:hypothetical protein